MATLEDEYIKSSVTGEISHRTSHNIVGNSNGSKDEKKVYRTNVSNGLRGDTIRNKYEPGNMVGGFPYYSESELNNHFTPSSEEAYARQEAAKEAEKAANAEREKLRPQYEREFFQWKPKNNSEAAKIDARGRGWMPFEEWYAKKKNKETMYSKKVNQDQAIDFLQREAAERRAALRQEAAERRAALRQEEAERRAALRQEAAERRAAERRQPKLNFEPPDNKDTGNQPSGNQPDVNQPEWCAIA